MSASKYTTIQSMLFFLAVVWGLGACKSKPPTIAYFHAPKIIKQGEPVTLSWKVNNLNKRKLGIRGVRSRKSLHAKDKKVLWPRRTSTFKLYVKNKRRKTLVSKRVKVLVVAASFVGADKILAGSTTRLSWRVPGPALNIKLAEEVNGHLQIIKEHLPRSGSYNVQPTKNTNYRLLVENKGGIIHFDHRIEVKDAFFTGSRVVTPEADAILQWDVSPTVDKAWLEQKEAGKFVKLQDNLPLHGRILFVPKYEQNHYRLVIERNGQQYTFAHKVRIKNIRPYIRSLLPVTKVKPGQKMNFEIFSYDRSNYPKEIKFQVLAHDPKGNFITGLAPNEATAKKYFLGLAEQVEGETIPINKFQVKEVNQRMSKPYSIATVLDYSGSMYGVTPNLETAIKEFIKQKNPHDEISVIKFDDRLVRKVQRAKNADHIIKKSNFDGNSGGSTALYAGADEGIKTIERSKHNRIMVLFTDGQENSSFSFSGSHAFTAKQLVKRARETNTRIFTVCFGNGANRNLLEAIAVLTDGRNYFLEDESEITKVYTELPYIFKNYYEVTYRPVKKDGSHQTILTYNNLQTVDTTSGTTHIGNDFDPNVYETFNNKPAYRSSGKVLKNAPTPTKTKPGSKFKKPRVIDLKKKKGRQPITPPQAVAFFKHNNSKIDKKYHKNLVVFLRYLRKNKKSSIHILGHSDLGGSVEGCIKISKERAEKVQKFFTDKGIAVSRITIKALGRSQPVWKQELKKVHARENRRVEILLIE